MAQVSRLDTLDKIFGGAGRVKVMRLFLFNQDEHFDTKDIARRAKIDQDKARKIVEQLEKVGMVKKRVFHKNVKTKTQGVKKKKTKGWIVDPHFAYLTPLKNMLVNIDPCRHKDIRDKFQNTGKIKLIVVSGLFIQEWDSRLDLLVVGDAIKKSVMDNALRSLEAEVGKELTYAVFDTAEFRYRLSVFDKLVRDVLDYPHEIVTNKLDMSLT